MLSLGPSSFAPNFPNSKSLTSRTRAISSPSSITSKLPQNTTVEDRTPTLPSKLTSMKFWSWATGTWSLQMSCLRTVNSTLAHLDCAFHYKNQPKSSKSTEHAGGTAVQRASTRGCCVWERMARRGACQRYFQGAFWPWSRATSWWGSGAFWKGARCLVEVFPSKERWLEWKGKLRDIGWLSRMRLRHGRLMRSGELTFKEER